MRIIGTRRRGRIIAGLIGAVLGGIYTVVAFQLPMGAADRPGPGVFPVVIGLLMIAVSLGTAVEALVSSAIEGDLELPRGPALRRVAVFAGGTLAMVIALPYIGLLAAAWLYFLLMVKVLGGRGWLAPIGFSLGLSVVICLLFVVVLKVPLDVLPLGVGF